MFDKRVVLWGILAMLQQGTQSSTVFSYSPAHFKEIGGNSFIIGFSSVIFILSAVLFSYISRTNIILKIGKRQRMVISMAMLSIYLFLFPLTENLLFALLFQLLPGPAAGIYFSCTTSMATEHVDKKYKNIAMGMYQSIFALGITMFPLINSLLISRLGFKKAYWFLGLPVQFLILLLLKMDESKFRREISRIKTIIRL